MAKQLTFRDRIVGFERIPADQLAAHPGNWRIHPDVQRRAMVGALREIGWADALVVRRDGDGYQILDGHLRADIAPGAPLPCVVVDLDDTESLKFLATHDPLAGLAQADADALAAIEASVTFEDNELAALLASVSASAEPSGPKPGLTDPDAVPEAAAEPYVQAGDLWVLGEHRLLCGDATNADDVARLLGGARAACMWTDPPYGVDYTGKTKRALKIDNDTAGGLLALLTEALVNATAALDPGAPYYIARPAGAQCFAFNDAIRTLGWHLHEELQWVKDTMVLGHSDYHIKHETIMYGYLPGAGRSGRGNHDGSRWVGGHDRVSVFDVPRPKRSSEHPTAKPVDLVEAMLRNHEGDVYDPFVGSGTTIIAAERQRRRCYAMEISPAYVQVSIERWQAYTGGTAEVER